MWKLALIVGLSFLPVHPTASITTTVLHLIEEVPPYAKWGQIAVQETKKKYPDIAIVDYLHIGKETTDGTTTEKFKLWLRGKEREFGVFIDIQFNTETEEITKIKFNETDR